MRNQIPFHFMKNMDDNIFAADKPSRMNIKFSSFVLHNRLFIKSSADNVQHTNNPKWQYIVELFESLNSEVAPKH